MKNQYIFWGCILAALSVAFGALGAHAIKQNFSEYSAGIFDTAAKFQMYHAMAIILLGLVAERKKHISFVLPAILFGGGILCFSGSLYLLAVKSAFSIDISFLGPVTPLGGLLFMAAWVIFAVKALKV